MMSQIQTSDQGLAHSRDSINMGRYIIGLLWLWSVFRSHLKGDAVFFPLRYWTWLTYTVPPIRIQFGTWKRGCWGWQLAGYLPQSRCSGNLCLKSVNAGGSDPNIR